MEAASPGIWNRVAPPGKETRSRPEPAGKVTHKAHIESGALVLGMIELRGRTLEAHVNCADRAAGLQDRLKDILGDLVSEPVMERRTVEEGPWKRRCPNG